MPQLPGQELPSVTPADPTGRFQAISVDTGAFGGYTAAAAGKSAAGLEQAAGAINDMVQRQQAIKNEADGNTAISGLLKATNELHYGRPRGTNGPDDPGVKGYQQTMGPEADAKYSDTLAALQKSHDDIRGTLNPTAQRQFDQQAFRIMRGTEGAMGAHRDQQIQAYNVAASKGKVDTVIQTSINAFGDPNDPNSMMQLRANLALLKQSSSEASEIIGRGANQDKMIGKEFIPASPAAQQAYQQEESTVYAGIVQKIATGDPTHPANPILAEQFLKANIDKVSNPAQLHQLNHMLQVATTAQYARADGAVPYEPQATVADIQATERFVLDNAKNVANARKPGDLVYQEQVLNEAHKNWAQALQVRQNIDHANTALVIGDGSIKSMSDLSGKQLAAFADLPGSVQHSIRTLIKSNQNESAPITADNTNKYFALKYQADHDPEEFKKRDIATEIQGMPHQFRDDLIKTYTGIDKAQAKDANKDLNWQKTKSEVNDIIKPMGLGTTAKGTKNLEDTQAFYGKLEDAIKQYRAQNNNKLPDTETTRKMAAGLAAQGKEKSSIWFDSSKPSFKVEDPSKFYVPVPSDKRDALAKSFQSGAGRTPTDEELTRYYTQYKLSGGK